MSHPAFTFIRLDRYTLRLTSQEIHHVHRLFTGSLEYCILIAGGIWSAWTWQRMSCSKCCAYVETVQGVILEKIILLRIWDILE